MDSKCKKKKKKSCTQSYQCLPLSDLRHTTYYLGSEKILRLKIWPDQHSKQDKPISVKFPWSVDLVTAEEFNFDTQICTIYQQ